MLAQAGSRIESASLACSNFCLSWMTRKIASANHERTSAWSRNQWNPSYQVCSTMHSSLLTSGDGSRVKTNSIYAVMSNVLSVGALWLWKLYRSRKIWFKNFGVMICLPCLSWRSGLLWGQNCLHMTAWQHIGSICTTDSAAGPEKLRQKAMAKSTAISLDRVLVLQSRPADHCTIWLINICLASVFP